MTDQAENVPTDESPGETTPLSDIETRLHEQLEELEALVREHPLATFGIAAGAGLIAALILSRH